MVLDALGWAPLGLDYTINRDSKYPKVVVLPKKSQKTESGNNRFECTDLFISYELRHRGVNGHLTLQELGKVLYHLNQRRGYQDIGLLNEEENVEDSTSLKLKSNQRRTFITLIKVLDTGNWNKKRKEFKYTAEENGKEISGISYIPYFNQYIGKTFETIIETDKEGTDYLNLYDPGQWSKSREENNASLGGRKIGEKLFQEILENHTKGGNRDSEFKIRKRVYDRKHYKNEFDTIWNKQVEQTNLLNTVSEEVLEKVVKILSPKNETKQHDLKKKGLKYILKNYIIFYQRELKPGSKKEVSLCRFEQPLKIELESGKHVTKKYKSLPSSHPLYQEFRIWSVINNFSIKDERGDEIYIDDAAYKVIYFLFRDKEEITTSEILKKLKLNTEGYFSNYRKDQKLKGNVTTTRITKALRKEKEEKINELLTNDKKLELLWHILFYVKHNEGFKKALSNRIYKINNEKFSFGFSDETIAALSKVGLEKDYGSLSKKAISRLLPLMKRLDWHIYKDIDLNTQSRIESILNRAENSLENLNERLSTKLSIFEKKENFQGLRFDEAAELVYGSHTKPKQDIEYENVDDIKLLAQHSLRHPVVEEVINETLKIVKDVWIYAKERPYAFHIELARELQNSKNERERIYAAQIENRGFNNEVKNIIKSEFDIPSPSLRQIQRYKLWQEQNHRCIYTNEYIDPANLFKKNKDGVYFYDVDHIIPKRRLFDDSFSNKVLCVKAANSAKDKQTARHFMETARNFPRLQSYDDFCDKIRSLPYPKRKKLLIKEEDIPSDFIERQKKETQYITRRVIEELSKIVGSENVHTTTGGVTAILRHEWGIDDIFKRVQKKRYLKFEEKLRQQGIDKILVNENNNKLEIFEYSKRSDHRHHALDALVVACTSPKHIKYLNDLNKIYQEKSEDNISLEEFVTEIINDNGKNKRRFRKPWKGFCDDVNQKLNEIIVSFKKKQSYTEWRQNKIKAGKDKTSGKPLTYIQKTSVLAIKGELHNQQPDSWRYIPSKPIKVTTIYKKITPLNKEEQTNYIHTLNLPAYFLHKVLNIINEIGDNSTLLKKALNSITNKQGDILEALPTYEMRISKRKKLNEIEEKDIREIRDARLKADIESHLKLFENEKRQADFSQAFNAEGIRLFNLNRTAANRQPVRAIQLIQQKKFDPFSIESPNKIIERKNSFNKKSVFTTSVKSWNIIYEDVSEHGKRIFKPVSLFDYVQSELYKESFVERLVGYKYVLFNTHSIMYMPDPDEDLISIDFTNKAIVSPKLYRFCRLSGDEWYFLPHITTVPLSYKTEYSGKEKIIREYGGSIDDFEKDLNYGRKIKQYGIPVEVDRLGNIKQIKWRMAN